MSDPRKRKKKTSYIYLLLGGQKAAERQSSRHVQFSNVKFSLQSCGLLVGHKDYEFFTDPRETGN